MTIKLIYEREWSESCYGGATMDGDERYMDIDQSLSLNARSFEVEGHTFRLQPCIYDEDGEPEIQLIYPDGTSTLVALHQFRINPEYELKKYLNFQIEQYFRGDHDDVFDDHQEGEGED